jgi:RecA-family ATPase
VAQSPKNDKKPPPKANKKPSPKTSNSSDQTHLPHWNEEAEKIILGTILHDPLAFPELQRLLRPGALYFELHRRIFAACVKLRTANVPIDTVTIRIEIERGGVTLEADDIANIERLSDYVSTIDGLKHYIDLVHDAELRRKLIQFSSETEKRARSNETETRDLLCENLANASQLVNLDRSRDGGSVIPRFQSAAEIMKEPPPVEVVQGIAYENKVTVLVSESGAGKTFVLFGISAAVSSDISWLGRNVQYGSVAYVSFEGDALGLRCRAIKEAQGHRLDNVYFLRACSPLSPIIDYDQHETSSPGAMLVKAQLRELSNSLTASGRPPIRLVVIDTVRASMTGSEDKSENIAAYMREVRLILAQVPDAGAIVAHHSGWQDGDSKAKRERGSSAFRGNTDQTVWLEFQSEDATRGEATLILKSEKMRDVEKLPLLYCIRRRVTLNEADPRGEPVTSCVIEPDRLSSAEREAETASAAEAKNRPLDLRTLRVIADRPDLATSKDHIQIALGVQRKVVLDTISRLAVLRWIELPEKQRQPYTVTDLGRIALQGMDSHES